MFEGRGLREEEGSLSSARQPRCAEKLESLGTNTFIRHLDVWEFNEVIADGLPLGHGAQFGHGHHTRVTIARRRAGRPTTVEWHCTILGGSKRLCVRFFGPGCRGQKKKGPEGRGPKISLFSVSPPHFSFILLLGVFPQMCTFGVLGMPCGNPGEDPQNREERNEHCGGRGEKATFRSGRGEKRRIKGHGSKKNHMSKEIVKQLSPKKRS